MQKNIDLNIMHKSKNKNENERQEKRYISTMDSPIGILSVVSDGTAILEIGFGAAGFEPTDPETAERRAAEVGQNGEKCPVNMQAIRQLTEYFEGRRREFELPLSPRGTPFQKQVWQALLSIPYGETRSYGEIAAAAGNPKASRAVGMANHHNPIAIVIPCHRVIGANGRLVGYGGGLDIKEKLLWLEQREKK